MGNKRFGESHVDNDDAYVKSWENVCWDDHEHAGRLLAIIHQVAYNQMKKDPTANNNIVCAGIEFEGEGFSVEILVTRLGVAGIKKLRKNFDEEMEAENAVIERKTIH